MEQIGMYNVTFVGQHFVLTTVVETPTERGEQYAKMSAINLLEETYGWNVNELSDEITAELEGTYS